MKKYLILCFILVFCFLAKPVLAFEKVNNFKIEIKINSDSSIDVAETILYDFGNLQKHGIYREIPYKYSARGGNFNLRFSNFSVTDEKHNPYKFSISNSGGYKKIKIGDADKFVTGQKYYIIKYRVERAINFFKDHDELYWNATGDEWEIYLNNIQTAVYLPENVSPEEIQAECYYGSRGSTNKCNYQKNTHQITYYQNSLIPQQGMTIVVGIPKGIIIKPSIIKNILWTLQDNGVFFLPVLTFIVMYILWRKKGKDPRGRGTIVPEYNPPKNINPAEMGVILDEKVDPHDTSAEIIYLAVHGFLKITRIPKKGAFSKDDYQLDKLKPEDESLSVYQKYLLSSLFEKNDRVKISQLKNKYYTDLELIKKKIYTSVVTKNYFPKNPNRVKGLYTGIGGAIIFICFAVFLGNLATFTIISIFLSGAIIAIFGSFMPVKTQEGVLAREHILGFKMFLKVTEKDRLKFHNAPEKDPKTFEKFLPYAMVLKVEKEWAQQFEGIYNASPSWYSDPVNTNFSALYLASSLNNFKNNSYSTLSSKPQSASRGGSGFSGGFSGGGFGGGGGGSW